MRFLVNPGDELPIYRQIMRQVTEAIAGGRLSPGDKMPSHRDLAEQLVIAPLTVKKAYDELERAGYIETARGRGTFVAERLPAIDNGERRRQLQDTARRMATEAYLGGIRLTELLKTVEDAYGELLAQRKETVR